MKHVVLDTSFILTAIKDRIDFLEEISFLGLTPLLPIQVIRELGQVNKSEKKMKFRDGAQFALRLFEKHPIKEIDIKNTYVDKGIINYAKENPDVVVATMDKELKQKLHNQKLIVRAGKKLEIV